MIRTKTCTSCGKTKNIKEGFSPRSGGGYKSHCKVCRNQKGKEERAELKENDPKTYEEKLASERERVAFNKKVLKQFTCPKCGYENKGG